MTFWVNFSSVSSGSFTIREAASQVRDLLGQGGSETTKMGTPNKLVWVVLKKLSRVVPILVDLRLNSESK